MATSAATTASVQAFQALVNEIHDLQGTQALLGWDLETLMPEKASPLRAKALATLAKLVHGLMTGPEMEEHMRMLRQPGMSDKLDSMTEALVREVGRSFDRDRKLPLELVQEMVETTSEAHKVWVEARANRQFKQFEPVLRKIVSLNQRMAEAIGYEHSPYDALLDEYEPGLTVKQLDPLFSSLRKELVPLFQAIRKSGYAPDASFLYKGAFPSDQQMAFCREILADIGFDFEAGRLDLSPHPFTSGAGTLDVRLTTRVDEQDVFSAISSSLHEGGHGMYEQGVNPALNRTPLAGGVSLGIHESQSRLWENQVGRSKAFWSHFFPRLQQRFPGLQSISLESFYHAINQVSPSFIRVEADEVTYNLHILLRYEIEKALIEDRMRVEEVPAVWNEKMQGYLGITPANDAEGPLQDIHWSHGSFGYFPTYTLGNLYAAQIFQAAKRQLPDLETQMAEGNLLPLKSWLNREIHWVGKMESAETIIERVTGEPLNPRYFIDYLWDKYGDIFQIHR